VGVCWGEAWRAHVVVAVAARQVVEQVRLVQVRQLRVVGHVLILGVAGVDGVGRRAQRRTARLGLHGRVLALDGDDRAAQEGHAVGRRVGVEAGLELRHGLSIAEKQWLNFAQRTSFCGDEPPP